MSTSEQALEKELANIIKFLELVQKGFNPEFGAIALATSCEEKTNYESLIIRWLELGNTLTDKFICAVKEQLDIPEITLFDKAISRLQSKNVIERRILDPRDLAAQIFETNKKRKWDSCLGYYLTDSYKNNPIKKNGFFHSSYRPLAFFDN